MANVKLVSAFCIECEGAGKAIKRFDLPWQGEVWEVRPINLSPRGYECWSNPCGLCQGTGRVLADPRYLQDF